LNDEPVQACPPSAGYRLRKFARRYKGRLVIAGLILALIVGLGGVVGWAVRDRAARQEEITQQTRDSLTQARRWIGENRLALARQELAKGRGRIGSNPTAFPSMTQELDALEARLDQFESFLVLIDQAHQAEFPGRRNWSFPRRRPRRRGPRSALEAVRADPARAVPYLLRALSRYEVMERDDWLAALEDGLLGPGQVTQVRRAAYEELLWLADDVTRRQQDHAPASSSRARSCPRGPGLLR
jgi:hypothetical protein